MTDRDMSLAYQAMTGAARHMLALIERELARSDGHTVAIRLVDFENLGVRPGTCGFALRQVVLFGFVNVEPGPLPRRISTFRLSDHWQFIDAVEAMRLRVEARNPKPRPKPVAKPRTMRQVPSLAKMSWDRAT